MLTLEEKIEIVLLCGETNRHRDVAQIFNNRHPNRNIQQSTVSRILTKFKQTGSVENNYKKKHTPLRNTEDVELSVCLDVIEHGQTTLPAISERTDVKQSSVRNILHKNKFHAFKPKFIHTLKERDFDVRFNFSIWFQGEREEDYYFPYNILWTDEATFSSNGVVNSQNCRWWAQVNPHFTIECKDQYSFKTNVFCGILNNKVIGPFFFRQNLTGERYLHFLQHELSEVLDEMPLCVRNKLWFQLDGAPVHNTIVVRNCLNQMFRGKVIGPGFNCHWPPRSPDLTPLDFFFWGYLKNKVYKNRPFRDIDHLENIIRQCISEINPDFLRNAVGHVSKQTEICIEREGRHTEM